MAELCKNCGALLAAGNIYCLNCGIPLVNIIDEQETVVRPKITQENLKNHQSKGFRISSAILSLLLLISLAALAFVLLRSENRPSTVSNNTPQKPSVQPSFEQSVVSIKSPTPDAASEVEPTPRVQKEEVSPNSIICETNAGTRAHRNCDNIDCDLDPNSVSDYLALGTQVAKTGYSKKSRRAYRWEKVMVMGRELWVASNKLNCGGARIPNGRPPVAWSANNTPLKPVNIMPPPPPPGAVARCRDGSYSKWTVNTCAMHGGIWYRLN